MQANFVEPRVVAIHHDGREVVRIVDGEVFGTLVSQVPTVLEIYWDSVLVYALRDGVVKVNQIRTVFAAVVIQSAETVVV